MGKPSSFVATTQQLGRWLNWIILALFVAVAGMLGWWFA